MFVAYGSWGQELTKGLIIKGRDTLSVDFKIPTYLFSDNIIYSAIQEKIKYFDLNGKKNIIKPADANEILLYHKEDTIRMVTHIDPIQVPCERCKTRYVFLKMEVDGNVKLYKYMKQYEHSYSHTVASDGFVIDMVPAGARIGKDYFYYYQKETDKIYSPNNLLFKKEMSKYFSDCKELINKIKAKEFKKKDAEEIVKFYNANCGQ